MSIDLTKAFEVLQRKISVFDSTGDTKDLRSLLQATLRGARSTVTSYDTEDDLPLLLDDSAGGNETEMLVYAKDSKKFYFQDFQNKLWKPLPATGFYQGSNAGFSSGQKAPGVHNIISYSFASNTGSYHNPTSNPVQLTQIGFFSAGSSSNTHGYIISGQKTLAPDPSPQVAYVTNIDRFPFSLPSTINLGVGDLNVGANNLMSATNSKDQKAFVFGGSLNPVTNPGIPSTSNRIEYFPFGSSVTSFDHGDLRVRVADGGGISSISNGYVISGYRYDPAPTPKLLADNWIDRFPFSSFTPISVKINSNPYSPSYGMSTAASEEKGYFVSGKRINSAPSALSNIYVFPFSSDNEAISQMDPQTQGRTNMIGWSSKTHGYSASGTYDGPSNPNAGLQTVERWSFANDGPVVDVGDISPTANSNFTNNLIAAANHF